MFAINRGHRNTQKMNLFSSERVEKCNFISHAKMSAPDLSWCGCATPVSAIKDIFVFVCVCRHFAYEYGYDKMDNNGDGHKKARITRTSVFSLEVSQNIRQIVIN